MYGYGLQGPVLSTQSLYIGGMPLYIQYDLVSILKKLCIQPGLSWAARQASLRQWLHRLRLRTDKVSTE